MKIAAYIRVATAEQLKACPKATTEKNCKLENTLNEEKRKILYSHKKGEK